MNIIDLVSLTVVAVSLAAIAVIDARTMVIDPVAACFLVVGGLCWQFAGSGLVYAGGSWWYPIIGAAIGILVVVVPIVVAELFARRWPVMPGDALLFGAIGWVTGPLGLGWSLGVGALMAAIHRIVIQRRRRRPLFVGYTPLGPGIAAGAIIVIVALTTGVLASQELPDQSLRATAIAPDTDRIPLQEPVRLEFASPVSLAFAVNRLSEVSGMPIRIDGAVSGDSEPRYTFLFEGPLATVLDHVARESGYQWREDDGVIVLEQNIMAHTRRAATRLNGTGPDPVPPAEPLWVIEGATHETLRDVLLSWCDQAGWSLVWRADHDYAAAADARFSGTFFEAIDLLLSDPATRRTLVATAYTENRQLVIEDATP